MSKNKEHNRDKLSSAYDESGIVCRTHVGGQALIEGIMMRGRYNWALAVRKPNGIIHVEEHDLASGKDKNSWMYKPVVRGCTSLVESLALGYKALEIAANYAFEDEEEEIKNEDPSCLPAHREAMLQDPEEGIEIEDPSSLPESPPVILSEAKDPQREAENGEIQATDAAAEERTEEVAAAETEEVAAAETEAVAADETEAEEIASVQTEEKAALRAVEPATKKKAESSESAMPKAVMTGAMIVGLLLGIGIFIVVPAVITNFIVGDYVEDILLWNLVDGLIRVAIFIGYIFLIGRMPDIKRMFGYHGAEHRTIHCYERGKDLTVANAQCYPSLHVRCGTAFMLMTLIIAIFVFTIVPVQLLINALGIHNEILRLIVVIFSRILLLPFIAGLSYEFTVKWAGSHPDNPLVKVVLWPGLQLQRLTTNPPDDGMVECAIAAMNAVLVRENLEAEKVIRARERAEAQQADANQDQTEALQA